MLPKDQRLPAWCYTIVSRVSQHTLTADRFSNMTLQIDCFADTAAGVQQLASAIDASLDGFSGVLTDDDSTRVLSCLSSSSMDFFEDAPRVFRRMLEFDVFYV